MRRHARCIFLPSIVPTLFRGYLASSYTLSVPSPYRRFCVRKSSSPQPSFTRPNSYSAYHHHSLHLGGRLLDPRAPRSSHDGEHAPPRLRARCFSSDGEQHKFPSGRVRDLDTSIAAQPGAADRLLELLRGRGSYRCDHRCLVVLLVLGWQGYA